MFIHILQEDLAIMSIIFGLFWHIFYALYFEVYILNILINYYHLYVICCTINQNQCRRTNEVISQSELSENH